jgi:hypothetical protein
MKIKPFEPVVYGDMSIQAYFQSLAQQFIDWANAIPEQLGSDQPEPDEQPNQ